MMKKKILLTGASGNIGNILLLNLLESYDVAIIVNKRLLNLFDNLKEKIIIINSASATFNKEIFEFGPEVCIHLASYVTSSHDYNSIAPIVDSNITFGLKLLDALSSVKLKYFINTGTFAEYHNNSKDLNPTYLYAASKSAFRNFIKFYSELNDFRIIHTVPYTVYGYRSSTPKLIDLVFSSTTSPNQVNLSPGEQIFDFIHVEDVINYFKCLLNFIDNLKGNRFVEYHIGTAIGTSIKELAKMIEIITQRKTNINWGGINYRIRDTNVAVSPYSMIEEIGWKSQISLETGISKYFNEFMR